MSTAAALGLAGLALLVATTALWALSLALRDSSIVDIFWGSGFVLVAWLVFAVAAGGGGRPLLIAALVSVWGLRLTAYLARRNLGKGEDRRYTEMRERHGARWPLRSLFIVFWLQGALVWIVSLPVQVGIAQGGGLVALDWLGVALWALGLCFEAVGDLQLSRFKADPANRGRVMDRGLWRYTRHPNYFGDFCVWWGIYLVALAAGAWWTVVGPLLMSWLLIRFSGVPILERSLHERRPGYAEYAARTSAFLPRRPQP